MPVYDPTFLEQNKEITPVQIFDTKKYIKELHKSLDSWKEEHKISTSKVAPVKTSHKTDVVHNIIDENVCI